MKGFLKNFWKRIVDEVKMWQFWVALAVGSLGIAYVVGPIDLIPDFLGLGGYVDDVIVGIIVFVLIKLLLSKPKK